MAKKPTKTGKALERQVADAYRAMGARRVDHDVELVGHQIDVYVEMETADRALHRIAIEAKDHAKPVGIEIVSDFAAVVRGLRTLKLIDEGVIVSTAGFSRPARNAAQEHGLRLLEPADLAAVAGLPDFVQMRADYLASLRQRFEYLDLGGIAPRVQNRTVKLRMEDVLVPVRARPELESQVEWLDWMNETPEDEEAEIPLRMLARSDLVSEAKPVEICDLLSRPRVAILGDPGCGKSTLLRHIAYAVACRMVESVGEAALERLPIFVHIVRFSQAQAQDRTLMLDVYIRRICEPRWATLFQNALDGGKALMLLDGLDEVVDAHQRKGVAEAIQRLVADYPGNAFVVTSRIVGYQAARLSGDFTHYTIQSLPIEAIAEFVEKWYAAIEQEAGEVELSGEALERAEELSRTIQERPGICRLAENPLLLTIIALVNWRGRKLPSRRVELYAHAAETLIESWPFRRQGVGLDTDRVIRLLSPVAYRLFATRSSGDIPEDELLPILAHAICRVDGVDGREARIYAEEFLEQISERSGIFRERGYDERGRRVFGFLHLTFAEYFAARYLAGLWEGMEDPEMRRAFLRKYVHVPRWHEVVMLMAGDIGLRDNDRAERATRLLGDILTLGSDYEDYLQRDLLVAGECLADDLRVQPQAARYVLDRLFKLIPLLGSSEVLRNVFFAMRETSYGAVMLECLSAQLEDQDWRVRRDTAWVLGDLGGKQMVEALLARLEDKSSHVRSAVVRALGEIGDRRAVEPMLARLKDGNSQVRWAAARSLGRLGDTRAVEPLLVRLKEDKSHVQSVAARALGELDDVRALKPLLARLRDRRVGQGARWALEEFCGVKPAKTLLTSLMSGAVVQASRQLSDARGVEQLIVRLDDESVVVRWVAAWMLGKVADARAVEPLLKRLEDDEWCVRQSAARALGKVRDVRAVEPLLEQLGDEEWCVRQSVARALGRLGDVRAVGPLLKLLEDEEWCVRQNAARALGKLGNVRAVKPLLAQLNDENKYVCSFVACALGRLGDMRAVEPLLTRLRDNSPLARKAAAWALGELGDRRAVEPLVEQLRDRDKYVQRAAVRALGKLGDVRAVEPLVAQLNDVDYAVRSSAAWALGGLGDVRAVKPLLTRLQDKNRHVRESAAQALGELGDMRILKALLAQLEDEKQRSKYAVHDALVTILNHNTPQPEVGEVGCEPQTVSGPWDC
jgi:HEAT repeat protein